MTKNEAREVLEELRLYWIDEYSAYQDEEVKALEVAIESLTERKAERISKDTIRVDFPDYAQINRIILTNNGDMWCKVFYSADFDDVVEKDFIGKRGELIAKLKHLEQFNSDVPAWVYKVIEHEIAAER